MEYSMHVSEHGTDMYVHVHEIMNVYVHVCTRLWIYVNVCNMYIHVHEITMFVCTWCIHVYALIALYVTVQGTYTFIYVNVCTYMILWQTRLYSFTTTIHFPSGPISLVTPASLSSAQALLLQSSLELACQAHHVRWIYMYIHVCTWYEHVPTCMYLVWPCTFLFFSDFVSKTSSS